MLTEAGSALGRSRQIRAIVALLAITAVLCAWATSPTAHAKKKRIVRGSFHAIAFPIPDPSIYIGECFRKNLVPINTVTESFTPPWDGVFVGQITSAAGGWQLLVVEATQEGRYGRLTMTGDTTPEVTLRKGQTVELVACNVSGLPEAEVRYEFSERAAPQPHAPAQRVARKITLEYSNPTPGTVWPVRHEFTCFNTDCPSVGVGSDDRYVEAVAKDLLGGPVSAMVFQWSAASGAYREDFFCTATQKPVEILPDATDVGVATAIGPCADGTPGYATSGEITLTFSNLPKR